jgi:hypothetical protein
VAQLVFNFRDELNVRWGKKAVSKGFLVNLIAPTKHRLVFATTRRGEIYLRQQIHVRFWQLKKRGKHFVSRFLVLKTADWVVGRWQTEDEKLGEQQWTEIERMNEAQSA